MCSAEKFGAASSGGKTSAIAPPIPHHPTRHFSQNKRLIRSVFCKWSRPLLTETAAQTEIDLTYSKQPPHEFLTETRIALLPSSPRAFFAERFRPQNRISNRLALSEFSEGYGLANRISNRFCTKNRSCTKETIKSFLTGARTHISVLRFCAEFTPKQSPPCKKESASRDASEQGKIPLNAQNEKELS
jgi:hypothetical protein